MKLYTHVEKGFPSVVTGTDIDGDELEVQVVLEETCKDLQGGRRV